MQLSIKAVGRFVPSSVLNNETTCQTVDTSEDWIEKEPE